MVRLGVEPFDGVTELVDVGASRARVHVRQHERARFPLGMKQRFVRVRVVEAIGHDRRELNLLADLVG